MDSLLKLHILKPKYLCFLQSVNIVTNVGGICFCLFLLYHLF